MTPPKPTLAEREDAIWVAYKRALAPAQAAFERAVAEALDARDAALKALREGQ